MLSQTTPKMNKAKIRNAVDAFKVHKDIDYINEHIKKPVIREMKKDR